MSAGAASSEARVLIEPIDAGSAEPLREAIDALGERCFPGANFAIDHELARPWSRIWVAFATRDDPPSFAGFLVTWHVADEVHVLQVATHEAARRRGVAASLMGEAMTYAKAHRVRILVLEVRQSNRAARGLYEKLGFSTFNVRERYYGDNDEDAIEMMLTLDPEAGLALPAPSEIRVDV